jgi:hypothetical protein
VKYAETCDPYGLPYIVHECPPKPFTKARHDVPSGGESEGSKAQLLNAALMPFPKLDGAMPSIKLVACCWTSFSFLEVLKPASSRGAGIDTSFREYCTMNAFQRTEQVLPEFHR